MSESTNNSAPVDDFCGAASQLRLSTKLMDWYQEPVTDEEVAAALGAELVATFRFAQQQLVGRVRKVTLEPAFCHSADVALRAASLGFPSGTVAVCLLHDVVEDTCGTIAEVPAALDRLAARFPADIVRDVGVLTNLYQLIFKGLAPKVRGDVPFEPRSVGAFRAAMDVLRYELPAATEARFASELDRLGRFLEEGADLSHGARIKARDRKFSLAQALQRQVYRLYVDDLAERTVTLALRPAEPAPFRAATVKLLDLTDNVRTSEVSNRLVLFKLLHKAESLLDRFHQRVLGGAVGERARSEGFEALHRLVQLRLVDQLEARWRAVAENFAETRFSGLVDFLAEQTIRLHDKYAVPADPVAAIKKLQASLLETHAA